MNEQRVTELDGFNKLVRGRDAVYLANENDVFVGRALILYGEYCQAEYELFDQLCPAGSFIAELGANCGAHTVRLAKKVGLGGQVVAYEPQPVVFQNLCGTISLNSLMNVNCLPYGLAAETGVLKIPALDYRQENNFGGISIDQVSDGTIPVPIHRFDDVYPYDRLDFLKIDVEGMERDVLIGASASIAKHQPIIYIENDNQEKSAALISWLFEAGYKLWWHRPLLFNADNYFQNAINIYGPTSSQNMLAIHNSISADIALPEITDINDFPVGHKNFVP